MKRAKVKFPCAVGLIFFLISMPFVLGLKNPSIHEGDLYSFLYVVLNLPVIYVFGSLCDSIVNHLWSTPDLYRSNAVFMVFAHLFWILFAFVVGVICDVANSSHNKTVHRIADKHGSR
jgi:Na+/H+-translocating membrane pyrophosphatase